MSFLMQNFYSKKEMYKFNPNEFHDYSVTKFILYFLRTKLNVFKYYLKYILPNKNVLRKTIRLKNSKKGKKVFIFGSGPSMNILDPKKISNFVKNENFDVIALNSFLFSDFSKLIKPNYMVFSDPVDFITVPANHINHFRSTHGQEDKRKAIDEGIPLFIPINFLKQTKQNHGKVFYFNDCPDYFAKKIDLLKARPFKTFTGMKAIACGVYMGYDEVYICGFDYDNFKRTTVDKENKITHEFAHYYESQRINRTISLDYSFGEHLYSCALSFIQHDKFKNNNIVNLNPNSFIDSFPKNQNLDVYC